MASAVDTREMHIRDMLQLLTGGRPYIFMIMSYGDERKPIFDYINGVTQEHFNIVCLRADQLMTAGYDLLDKIHRCIAGAELVIAEISELSPNVFYEIGYAVGIGKLPILVMERGATVPTDLKGLEVIEYRNAIGGQGQFERDLAKHLRFRLNSELAVIRDMLQAPQPVPSYIVASPKYPGKHCRIQGQVYDSRTFGDHLGILGLLSTFGSMWGEVKGVELISAQHAPPNLAEHDINLYLIGSRKANPVCEKLMPLLQRNGALQWVFKPVDGFTESDGDWPVAFYRCEAGTEKLLVGELEEIGPEKEQVWVSDYGLILRAPHPHFPKTRTVLIMAGSHSLGTGAACLAATRSPLIQQIRAKLPPGKLEDKNCAFWVLVKGTASRNDYLLDEDGVEIVDAGVYA